MPGTHTPYSVGIRFGALKLFCVRIGVYLLGFTVFVNIGCHNACVSGFIDEVFRFRIEAFLDRGCLECGDSVLVAW